MVSITIKYTIALLCLLLTQPAWAVDFDTTVPMREGGKSAYYVSGLLMGYGDVELLVDTGSGYLTINSETLAVLKQKGNAHYKRDLKGTLANGETMVVPVYAVSGLNIGGVCQLPEVEAAVFPGATRQILGLNALSKAAPFVFSVNPPKLILSNCSQTTDV